MLRVFAFGVATDRASSTPSAERWRLAGSVR
jgi:hypothetical protein